MAALRDPVSIDTQRGIPLIALWNRFDYHSHRPAHRTQHGQVCFNFKVVDDKLFKELARLTDKGYKRFKKEKPIG